jgi:hypothetical protein
VKQKKIKKKEKVLTRIRLTIKKAPLKKNKNKKAPLKKNKNNLKKTLQTQRPRPIQRETRETTLKNRKTPKNQKLATKNKTMKKPLNIMKKKKKKHFQKKPRKKETKPKHA